MRQRRWWTICGIVVATGCSPPRAMTADDSAATSTTHADTTTSHTAADVAAPSGPPSIVDLGASALTLTQDQTATVTAVVRDPDDDVTGGSLGSADSVYAYGTFEPGLNGRWTLELDWAALHVDPDLGFVGTTDVTVVARFVDATDATAQASLTLRLTCPGILGADCGGTCTDLDGDTNHCGACGQACPTVTLVGESAVGGCQQQSCLPTWSPCVSTQRFADCGQVCASLGSECVWEGCNSETYRTYTDTTTCTALQPGTPAFIDSCGPSPEDPWQPGGAVRCCCSTG